MKLYQQLGLHLCVHFDIFQRRTITARSNMNLPGRKSENGPVDINLNGFFFRNRVRLIMTNDLPWDLP